MMAADESGTNKKHRHKSARGILQINQRKERERHEKESPGSTYGGYFIVHRQRSGLREYV
jgi:hypothetical protein